MELENETVVLIHGLFTNGMDMSLLAKRFKKQGFKVSQFRYNSRKSPPRESARMLRDVVEKIETPIVHFVCHSLGGLVIRHFFDLYPEQRPGRVVTLGTPHKPSYSAYKIFRFPFGNILLGKSTENGLLGNVPKWNGSHQLGSIAGSLRLGLGMIVPAVPRPNDGTVTVEETKCENMRDHVILKVSHFALLLSSTSAMHAVEFIRNGRFPSI